MGDGACIGRDIGACRNPEGNRWKRSRRGSGSGISAPTDIAFAHEYQTLHSRPIDLPVFMKTAKTHKRHGGEMVKKRPSTSVTFSQKVVHGRPSAADRQQRRRTTIRGNVASVKNASHRSPGELMIGASRLPCRSRAAAG